MKDLIGFYFTRCSNCLLLALIKNQINLFLKLYFINKILA